VRIVYVCADRGIPLLGGKGASVHVRQITTALQRRGHRVTVACARLGTGNPPPDVERVVELRGVDEASIAGAVRDTHADVVLERYALESGPARQLATSLGLPLVLEVNAPIVLEASRYRGLADVAPALERERAVFAAADAIVVVSQALASYVGTVAPVARVTWVPNGVDADRFFGAPALELGLPHEAVPAVFVGSMKAWHGVNDLLRAFRLVAAGDDRAHLVIAGTGPEEAAVAAAVAADGLLSERVRLLGALPHETVPRLLRAAAVAVAPYRPSADFYFSPLKVLEYLAAGVATVYPTLGDLPEMVGDAGLAYTPGDVDALAAALRSLVGDAPLRSVLGSRARRQGRRWTWDNTAAQIEALLAEAGTKVGT
jgi:glycosyltransferase involved in cell wall biosynthesis